MMDITLILVIGLSLFVTAGLYWVERTEERGKPTSPNTGKTRQVFDQIKEAENRAHTLPAYRRGFRPPAWKIGEYWDE
jgi:hypothetical protein